MPPFKSELLEHAGRRRQAGPAANSPKGKPLRFFITWLVDYNGDHVDTTTVNGWTIGGRLHRKKSSVRKVKNCSFLEDFL